MTGLTSYLLVVIVELTNPEKKAASAESLVVAGYASIHALLETIAPQSLAEALGVVLASLVAVKQQTCQAC